jgi:ribonuclease HI
MSIPQNNLHFYTDASIQNICSPNIRTGIGWILENYSYIKFNAAILSTLNSTQAEMEAIIPILLIIPQNLSIHIHTDNLSAIHLIKQLPYSNYTQLKHPNWNTLHIINYLLQLKQTKLILHKIKSHSKNAYNTNADLLAKKGTNKSILQINFNFLFSQPYFSWHQNILPIQLRKFIKNTLFIETFNRFLQLKSISQFPNFNIKLFILILNSQNYNISNYSIRIKIILNNLPTMKNLHRRYPYLYLTSNCIQCNQLENTLHLLSCPSNIYSPTYILTQNINQSINTLKIENIPTQSIYNTLFPSNQKHLQYNNLLLYIQGIFNQTTFNLLQNYLNKHTQNFCLLLSNNLLHWFQKILGKFEIQINIYGKIIEE